MNIWPRAYGAASNSPSHSERDAADYIRNRNRGRDALRGVRVLVVEDEFIIALEIQSDLEDAGATVVGPAYTLAAAIELAAHADITAATLDLRLGRSSVRPVAQILTERGIPFVFYTGQPAADPVRAEWPRARVLSKPAEAEEIVRSIAELAKLHS
jgi:CheY-like chemotaxis protein